VLKYFISNLKFSPIRPYQDECHAVFLCGVNYVAEEFRLCVKRVNVSKKHIFKKEIFKDEIRNRSEWNWKRKLQTAKMHCLLRTVQMEEEIFSLNERGKLNLFFLNLGFLC
jgi:hypothetical protein